MTKEQFRLLHACLFLKRGKLIEKEEQIRTLDDVDTLYVKAKENRGLKQLYGYDGSSDATYETQSLFDIMVIYLTENYPDKYENAAFMSLSSLTRRLYLNYKNYLLTNNPNKTVVTISKEYYNIYYDFLGISSLIELNDYAVNHCLITEAEAKASTALFFKGYYYTTEENQINTLLLKIHGNDATIFLPRYDKNPRHKYYGKIQVLKSILTFDLESEKDTNGKVMMITKLGHNPLDRLENLDIFFGTYCSIVSLEKLSCGVIGFEFIPNLNNEENFSEWNAPIPVYFSYLLAKRDIIYQREHVTANVLWKYDHTSLNDLEHSRQKELRAYKKGIINIQQLVGIYKGYSLNTKRDKPISISYCKLDEKGCVKFRIVDVSTRVTEELIGYIQVDDHVYVFSLTGLNRKVTMLFERRDDHSDTLYGVYIGVFRSEIAGGRIVLVKDKNEECNFFDLQPSRFSLESNEYRQLLELENGKCYNFFAGNLADEYIDDTHIIKYKTKAKVPLPIPAYKYTRFKHYEGTYLLYFMYRDQEGERHGIRACPLSINEHGYVSVKSLWSENTNAFYNGRGFIQEDKLYIHLYYNNWKIYQGLLVFQVMSTIGETNISSSSDNLYQFTGTYTVGNQRSALATGRVHLIQRSKECGNFNTMEVETYPCYTKRYQPLIVDGSSIDLRREFMGNNYNSIKLTKRINDDLNKNKKGVSEIDAPNNRSDVKSSYLREQNYASIYFRATIFSLEKSDKISNKGIRKYAKDLFWKALEHGWDEEFLDDYDREKYEKYKEILKPVLQKFSRKYL